MTDLRKWRKIAKSLIIFCFAWEAAGTIVSFVLLIRGGLALPYACVWIETARELGRPVPAPRGRLMYA